MRVGKFGYLNNFLPYFYLNGFEIVETTPKEMASKLLDGEIDYAPVPSFFYLSNKHLLRHYNFCVASKGKVLSVVVVSKGKELDDGSIAVTPDTMTSVNLLRIILKERGMRNRLVEVKSSKAMEMLKICDHALVIGDEAIKARMLFKVVMDLGEEWYELTSLPMVFGISASIRDVDASSVDAALLNSLRRARENLELVVDKAAKLFKMPEEFLVEYFKTLRFEFGYEERRGLNEFERMCRDYGLL